VALEVRKHFTDDKVKEEPFHIIHSRNEADAALEELQADAEAKDRYFWLD
jgi:hypothetical protein